MIRYKDKVFEDFFIDPVTALITDKDGAVQNVRICQGRPFFKRMPVHCIQAHTAWGYKGKGWDVHHIDENKMNNALSNLQYKERRKHISDHMQGKKYALGCRHSEESKQHMSEIMTGREISQEARAKISVANSGERNPRYGKEVTTDIRAKISAANSGEKNGMFGKRLPDEVLNRFKVLFKGNQFAKGATLGKHWFNNGKENGLFFEPPSDEWQVGRMK